MALRFTLIILSTLLFGGMASYSFLPEARAQSVNATLEDTNAAFLEAMPRLDWQEFAQKINKRLKEDSKSLRAAFTQIHSDTNPLSQITLQNLITNVKAVKQDTKNTLSQLQAYDGAIASVLEVLGQDAVAGEDSSVTRQRTDAQKATRLIKATTVQARLYDLQARNLLSDLEKLRSKIQHDTLSKRSASPLTFSYWESLPAELPSGSFSLTKNSKLGQNSFLFISAIAILCVAYIGGTFLRRRFTASFIKWLNHEAIKTSSTDRLVRFLCGLMWGGIAFLSWIGWSGFFYSKITQTEQIIGQTLPICAFILGAGLPLRHWYHGKTNHRSSLSLTLAVLFYALIKTLKDQELLGPTLNAFLEGLFSCVGIICLFMIIPHAQQQTPSTEPETESTEDSFYKSIFVNYSKPLRAVIFLYALLNLGLILSGYSAFAFTINTAIISVIYALSLTGCLVGAWQACMNIVFSPHTISGKHLLKLGVSKRRLEFLNVLISAIGSILFLVVFIALLTNEGDFTVAGIIDRIRQVFTGSTIHGIFLSPEKLFGCFALIIGSHYLIKLIHIWLDKRFFPTTTLNSGVQTSILSIFTYCAWILVGLLLLSLVGLSVQNLTWVVSALSVGVGFGLQSIVKDFISGIILLAERPIEAGDIIEVSGNRGEIKRVNVRTTDIRLGDGSTLIVPNSQFITTNVKNASFGNIPAKITLTFTLPINSDLDKARTLILEAAKKQEDILQSPAPSITLSATDDTTFNLSLSAYVDRPGKMGSVKNALLFDLFHIFREAHMTLTMS
ncbi:mechanosensitive ion channel [Aristophania vespae]|uniref:Mechanosensitive ion channel n=1 Tax=Aristophania vespae TaxID=2697033 RepID=A0A6P1NCA7_9PROT|nr:mechanosensitive ion channel domain-containing protein [Aristophania vespae]QHI95089.1 mechanosensitive ion channel [Aristophania vespae]